MTEIPTIPLPPLHSDPTPYHAEDYRRLRAEGPVVRLPIATGGPDVWLVTQYAEVRKVLSDPAHFSNAALQPQGGPADRSDESLKGFVIGNPLMYDPPEHTRLRRLLTGQFTVARMRHLRPRIEQIVTEHLDAMEAAGPPADLVQAFSLPVPSLVICELLGVPYADREDFQRRSTRLLDMTLDREAHAANTAEMNAYMSELIRRERAEPGEELLGLLVREHGGELTDDELLGIGNTLLVAGHETTANMLSLGTLLLLHRPDQAAVIRDEPDAVTPAVEELLRYLSVAHRGGPPRHATEDIMLGGCQIKAGDLVIPSLLAANRDEAFVKESDELDVTRDAGGHIAFGHGVHHCLGAPLARVEMQVAFPALLQRFPGLKLAAPFESLRFRLQSTVYGVESLPVTW
ncbi:cytochrome P450 [Nonomuraea sp. NPDC049480]|uniref:cytochrome P450 n=1 Tax=Nonomuraea sp. NPDC049480 TaxID=3364353 RepID=UPI00378C6BAA